MCIGAPVDNRASGKTRISKSQRNLIGFWRGKVFIQITSEVSKEKI